MSKISKNNNNVLSSEQSNIYKTLFEQSVDGIIIADENGHLVDVNPRLCQMLGYARQEILNFFISDIIGSKDPKYNLWPGQTLSKGGSSFLECSLQHKDGQSIPVEINAMFLEKDKFFGMVRDISTRKSTEDALRTNEGRLQLALETAEMGQWDYDITTGEVIWSDRCKAQYGYTPETDMSYDLFIQAVHPDDRDRIIAALNRAVEEHSGYEEVKRTVWPDGSLHWTHSRAKVFSNDKGEPIRMIGVTFDITERKRTEDALKASEKELRTLVNAMTDVVVVVNSEGRYLKIVDTDSSHFYKPIQDVLGKTLHEVFPKDKADFFLDKIRTALNTHNAINFEYSLPINGRESWFNATLSPMADDQVLLVARDISLHKYAEETLQKSEANLQLALDASGMGDWNWDIITEEINWSTRCKTVFGFPPDKDVTYDELINRLYPDDIERIEAALKQAVDEGLDFNVESRVKWPDGSVHWIASRGRVYYNSANEPVRMTGVSSDITERKRAEQEHLTHLQYFENMDKINRAIQSTNDIDQMMSDVLDVILEIFDCDRAYLLYPCDPDSPTWKVPMERTKPEYPGAFKENVEIKMDAGIKKKLNALLSVDGPLQFGPESEYPLPEKIAKQFNIKSIIATALYPKTGKPWEFGIQQCSYARLWNDEEKRLLQEISRRISDVLSILLTYQHLEESEQKYRLIAENTADTISVFDLNLRQLYISPSVQKLRGFSVQEALTQSMKEILPPKSLETAKRVFTEQLKLEEDGKADPNRTVLLELEEYCKDGSTIWVELAVSVLRDKYNKPSGILTVTRNISKRKMAELQLIDSERKFRSLAESSPDNIMRYDTEGRLLYINRNMDNTVGINFRSVIGKNPENELPDEPPKNYIATLKKVIKAGKSEDLEVIVPNMEGEMRTHHIAFVAERNSDGKIIGALAIGRDITERKQGEEALRKLSYAVEQSPSAIVITDVSGKIEYVNPKFTEVTGYSADRVIGKNPRILKSGESSKEFYKELWDTILGGNIWKGEFHNRKKNSELYYESASISPILDDSGRITHFIAIKDDITEHKRLEDQLHQSQKMEAIGQLAGGVAHDFNNMLSVILGYSELLLQRVDPSQLMHRELQQIRNAAINSSNLTQQLLTFARKQTITPQIVKLGEIVEGMLKMLQRLISEQIKLDWKPETNLWFVKIDPSQVNQILANLCVNARDAIKGFGTITIEVKNVTIDMDFSATHPGIVAGEYVLLSVMDTGSGIEKKVVDKIFEPFFTTKEVGKGTGLGLSTIYGIVKQNNGYIDVYSEPGEGTTFKIYLPRYYKSKKKIRTKKQENKIAGGYETILLVEDNEEILEMTAVMLTKLGYRILTAPAPRKAIKIAKEHTDNIDLLITDVIMPEMNGRMLVEKLTSKNPGMKYLYMSGYSGEIIAHNNIIEDDINFIQKPFSLEDLSAAIRKVLGSEDT